MVFSLILLFMTSFAVADVLLIEEVRQTDNMAVPQNGQTQAEVEARFGSPESKEGPVGDPPISHWTYPSWSVYFEYDRVLFTVLHKGAVIENAGQDS
jgi:hypothetical protein